MISSFLSLSKEIDYFLHQLIKKIMNLLNFHKSRGQTALQEKLNQLQLAYFIQREEIQVTYEESKVKKINEYLAQLNSLDRKQQTSIVKMKYDPIKTRFTNCHSMLYSSKLTQGITAIKEHLNKLIALQELKALQAEKAASQTRIFSYKEHGALETRKTAIKNRLAENQYFYDVLVRRAGFTAQDIAWSTFQKIHTQNMTQSKTQTKKIALDALYQAIAKDYDQKMSDGMERPKEEKQAQDIALKAQIRYDQEAKAKKKSSQYKKMAQKMTCMKKTTSIKASELISQKQMGIFGFLSKKLMQTLTLSHFIFIFNQIIIRYNMNNQQSTKQLTLRKKQLCF